MTYFAHKLATAVLFAGLALSGNAAQAQNKISTAVQQGNGAYILKNDYESTIGNGLLGLPNLPTSAVIPMKQVKAVFTPSGNSMTVWKGTAPEANRPTQRLVFNSTWTETINGVVYNCLTEAVTMPNGDITLTLTDKGNQKQNGRGKNK